jgi:ubiquinone/menaquinone biosynthesis C-methylase UbiE
MGEEAHHPLFARVWGWASPRAEAHGMADRRRELLTGLGGEVLEVGAGNGLNFGHYPTAVTAVTALEPEPHLRRLAQRAAASAPVPVTVLDGVAERIPRPDASFDHVVASLVLCSVADPTAVLAELWRVLRPGGGLRYLEHVVAQQRAGAGLQRALDATVWPTLAGGCHLSRDTGAVIRAAGFRVVSEQRAAQAVGRLPAIPHVLGAAVRA